MEDLLLLHGALGASDQFTDLTATLHHYKAHLLNFPGHGGSESPREFSIPVFAKAVLDYMDEKKIESTSIFGYSMGGYVALYIARHYPGRLKKIITLATKVEWNEAIALKEMKMLDPEMMEQKIPAFTQQLATRHSPNDWKEMVEKTKAMMLRLGQNNILQPEDYKHISAPALLLLGDRDKMVTITETVDVYKQLQSGQLGILPATPHPFEQVNSELLGSFINRFLYQPIP